MNVTNEEIIKKANALFESLNPSERRVEIARDVLKQLNAKKYTALKGRYVKGDEYVQTGNELCCLLNSKKAPKCKVCARGSLLMSAIRKFDNYIHPYNNFSLSDVGNNMSPDEHTEDEIKYFDKSQLNLMEVFFEGFFNSLSDGLASLKPALKKYRNSVRPKKADKLLRTIMLNLIRNNGQFVIPKRYASRSKRGAS